ncbi:MAG: group III truncated hemoglobin [Pyrinomonadaceae bacterium]
MKTDIENRKDIDRLMQVFYSKALTDAVIGYIFTDVAKLDLEHHLPIIGDFWETMLFRTSDYSRHGRNPLEVHGELNKNTPLLPEHFERWLEIFTATTDELFEGEMADFIKLRAAAIAVRMLTFVAGVEQNENIQTHTL